MVAVAADPQAEFYRDWLMARDAFDPRDFGIDMSKEELTDLLVERLNVVFRGAWTIDELLLHPLSAHRFCDDVRMERGWYDVPDDVLLRPMMIRRKNPNR